jgi:hypothetical protein
MVDDTGNLHMGGQDRDRESAKVESWRANFCRKQVLESSPQFVDSHGVRFRVAHFCDQRARAPEVCDSLHAFICEHIAMRPDWKMFGIRFHRPRTRTRSLHSSRRLTHPFGPVIVLVTQRCAP